MKCTFCPAEADITMSVVAMTRAGEAFANRYNEDILQNDCTVPRNLGRRVPVCMSCVAAGKLSGRALFVEGKLTAAPAKATPAKV